MKKLKSALFIVILTVIVVLAVLDTFSIVTYDQMLVFLKLRDPEFTSAELSVHFIDVGQGDSTLIISGEKTVLIDGGEKESGYSVVSYIKSRNIKSIDYVIASHPHSDHIGGLQDVMDNFEIKELIVPSVSEQIVSESYTYSELLDSAEEKNINITEALPGEKFNLGLSELDIIGPCGSYDEVNNLSVVAELIHGDNRFLFTADAESDSENDMIRNGLLDDIDVLKAGHHGSSTSSGREFIEVVKPEYAVISCGAGNSYNHPSESVMRSFSDKHVRIFRTDIQGSIIAESDGQALNFITKGKE